VPDEKILTRLCKNVIPDHDDAAMGDGHWASPYEREVAARATISGLKPAAPSSIQPRPQRGFFFMS